MLLDSGSAEGVKGAVHGALGVLAAVCTAYNASAYLRRRESHLAINAAVYFGLTLWEVRKVRHHYAT